MFSIFGKVIYSLVVMTSRDRLRVYIHMYLYKKNRLDLLQNVNFSFSVNMFCSFVVNINCKQFC
jgi:hypothetical protein